MNDLHSTQTHEKRGGYKAPRQGSHKHGCRKHQVAADPGSQQVRLHAVKLLKEASHCPRRPVRITIIIRRPHNHGQKESTYEADSRVNHQSRTSNPSNIPQRVSRLLRTRRHIVAKVRLADPGGAVEEKREPADPGPKLGPADGLDARRQGEQRGADLAEDAQGVVEVLLLVVVVLAGDEDALGDGPAGDGGGAEDCHGGDDGELLELRVAEAGAQEADEVDGAGAVADHVADGVHAAACLFDDDV